MVRELVFWLRSNSKDDLTCDIVTILGVLCKSGAANHACVVARDGIEATLERMAENSERHFDYDLQQTCLYALSIMLSDNLSSTAQRLLDARGLDRIVKTLELAQTHFSWNADVPKMACCALASLATVPAACSAMVAADVPVVVTGVLETQLAAAKEDPDVVQEAVKVMAALAKSPCLVSGEDDGFVLLENTGAADALVISGSPSVLMKVLLKAEEEAIMSLSCDALLALCREAPEARRMVLDSGGLQKLADRLDKKKGTDIEQPMRDLLDVLRGVETKMVRKTISKREKKKKSHVV